MPYKNKEKLRTAQRNYTRKFDKYPIMLFNRIKSRIKRKPSYKDRKLLIDKDTFVSWMINNPVYKTLYDVWEKSGYDLKCP